ncbi:hypothetical protein SAMN05720354_10783 [Nitrosospira sp. Nsp1]|nr:hypothetical protein SAMN05720354_10783 [Nitrosospira sp. Nsp1]
MIAPELVLVRSRNFRLLTLPQNQYRSKWKFLNRYAYRERHFPLLEHIQLALPTAMQDEGAFHMALAPFVNFAPDIL